METIIVVIVALAVACGAYLYTKQPDSPVEQAAEAVIDAELGLPPGTIDISKDKK